MNVICKYCGGIGDIRLESCPSCGAIDWSGKDSGSPVAVGYSVEFMEKLCSIGTHSIVPDTEVILEGSYSERILILPERIYISEEYEGIKTFITNWLESILIERVPEFLDWNKDIDKRGKVCITYPDMAAFNHAYSNLEPRMFREIYLALNNNGLAINALYVGDTFKYNGVIYPLKLWIDGYTTDKRKIVDKAIKTVIKDCGLHDDLNKDIQDINMLTGMKLQYGISSEISKFTWNDIRRYACLYDNNYVSQCTSGFINGHVYEHRWLPIGPRSSRTYVLHMESGYSLMLPDGVILEDVTGTNTVEYNHKKVQIIDDSTMRCVDDKNLKFIASFQEKKGPLGALSTLLNAAKASGQK